MLGAVGGVVVVGAAVQVLRTGLELTRRFGLESLASLVLAGKLIAARGRGAVSALVERLSTLVLARVGVGGRLVLEVVVGCHAVVTGRQWLGALGVWKRDCQRTSLLQLQQRSSRLVTYWKCLRTTWLVV